MDIQTQLRAAFTKESPKRLFEILQDSTSKFGWRKTSKSLKTELEYYYANQWFGRNKILLQMLGVQELIGYSGNVYSAFKNMKETTDFEQVVSFVKKKLNRLVEKQFQRGGPTGLFDLDKMQVSETAFLVSSLIQTRRIRFAIALDDCLENLDFSRQYFSKRDQHLGKLDNTYYGHRILETFSDGSFYESQNFKEILQKASTELRDVKRIELQMNDNDRQMEHLIRYLYHEDDYFDREEKLISWGFLNPVDLVSKLVSSIKSGESIEIEHIGEIADIAIKQDLLEHSFRTSLSMNLEDADVYANEVLLTPLGYTDISDNPFWMHEKSVEILKKSSRLKKALIDFIKMIKVDASDWGCNTDFEPQNTSSDAFLKVLDVSLENGLESIIFQKLVGICDDILPWSRDTIFRGMILERLVRSGGFDAIEYLMDYLDWEHPKYDCGTGMDWDVCNEIVKFGLKVVPLLENRIINKDTYDQRVSEGALYILTKFPGSGGEYIIQALRDIMSHGIYNERVEQLWEHIREDNKYSKIAAFLIHGSLENYQPIASSVQKILKNSSTREIIKALESDDREMVLGVCYFLMKDHQITTAIRRTLRRIIFRRGDHSYQAMWVAGNRGETSLFDSMMVALSQEIDNPQYISEYLEATRLLIEKSQKVLFKKIKRYLKNSRVEYRTAALLLVGYLYQYDETRAILKMNDCLELGASLNKGLSSDYFERREHLLEHAKEFAREESNISQ